MGAEVEVEQVSDSGARALKVAVAGKGGVGKTTLASLLAGYFRDRGRRVLAIDADPSPCLGEALGFPAEKLQRLSPLSEMDELIAERTGSESGGFFKLNPRVDDLPGKFSQVHDGVRLLLLGSVQHGGAGCFCPASTLLQQLVRRVMLSKDEVVLLDLYAGVEHLGRATADSVDVMLIVVEPTMRSIKTAIQVRDLAADIGITNVLLVGNKLAGEEDAKFITKNSSGFELAGLLPFTGAAFAADREGSALYRLDPSLSLAIEEIANQVEFSVAAAAF